MMTVKYLRDILDRLLDGGAVNEDEEIGFKIPDDNSGDTEIADLGIMGLSLYNNGSIKLELWYCDKEDD